MPAYIAAERNVYDPMPSFRRVPFVRNVTETWRSSAGVGAGIFASTGGTMAAHRDVLASTQSAKEGGGSKKTPNLFKSGGGGGAGAGAAAASGAVGGSGSNAQRTPPPVEYTMLLHPPLVVENLLPHAGDFELVDQVRSRRPRQTP